MPGWRRLRGIGLSDELMRALLLIITAAAMAACAAAGPTSEAPAPVTGERSAEQQQDVRFGNREAMASIEPAVSDDPGYWDEEICRRTPITGSRQTQRRCHTRWEWSQMEAAATETMRDIWMIPRTVRD
jgi:hypothetical protein